MSIRMREHGVTVEASSFQASQHASADQAARRFMEAAFHG